MPFERYVKPAESLLKPSSAPLKLISHPLSVSNAEKSTGVIQTPAPLVYPRASSPERRDVPWFPNDPIAVKNAAYDGTIPVGLATRQRKAQADGGVGEPDWARRRR